MRSANYHLACLPRGFDAASSADKCRYPLRPADTVELVAFASSVAFGGRNGAMECMRDLPVEVHRSKFHLL